MKEGVRKAEWIPFGIIDAPPYLDNFYAGDRGFDPLGIITKDGPWWPGIKDPKRRVAYMREAEIKHGRLAMLAAAGWPLSELWHGPITQFLNLPYKLDESAGRAPSVLNGNFNEALPLFIVVLLYTAYLDIKNLDNVHGLTPYGKTISTRGGIVEKSYTPGDYEFDPLSFYYFWGQQDPNRVKELTSEDQNVQWGWYAKQRKVMEEREIRNGRLAMMAITGFAIQEAIFGVPVVDQSPVFFINPVKFFELILQ
jgi:hypothetical protein